LSFSPFYQSSPPHRHLYSFPTRRSSDLSRSAIALKLNPTNAAGAATVMRISICYRKYRRKTSFSLEAGTTFRCSVSSQTKSKPRSEEHTSELQSLAYLVCRLLLEKKKTN